MCMLSFVLGACLRHRLCLRHRYVHTYEQIEPRDNEQEET